MSRVGLFPSKIMFCSPFPALLLALSPIASLRLVLVRLHFVFSISSPRPSSTITTDSQSSERVFRSIPETSSGRQKHIFHSCHLFVCPFRREVAHLPPLTTLPISVQVQHQPDRSIASLPKLERDPNTILHRPLRMPPTYSCQDSKLLSESRAKISERLRRH